VDSLPAIPKAVGKNRTHLPPAPSKASRMQTMKGLTALVVVALAVFAVVGHHDIKSQDHYAAQLRNAATAYVAKTGNQTASQTATNMLHQARHKVTNKNL
jgi:DNA repair exonuclease SbcCD nuclease subunit